MEDLARRLVDAVRPYVWACQDAQAPEDVEELSHNATAAVLRIVAEAAAGTAEGVDVTDDWDAGWRWMSTLADEIEQQR